MSENFNIYLKRNFEVKETINFLDKVYKIYKGKLFLPESVRMDGKEYFLEDKSFEMIQNKLDEKICIIHIEFKSINSRLYIHFKVYDLNKKSFEDEYRVHFSLPFNIRFDKEQLNEMIDFAIDLMEAQKEDLFVGGREIASFEYAEPWVWVIGYKEKNKLLYYLKNHIKYHFKLELTTNKIEKILQKTAKVEKINGVNILFLADLDRWKKDPDNYKIEFYQELKKLKK